METLYDILEVSRKASPEVIDKAYKILAKRYHPDLKSGEEKLVAEEKMKQIQNEIEEKTGVFVVQMLKISSFK